MARKCSLDLRNKPLVPLVLSLASGQSLVEAYFYNRLAVFIAYSFHYQLNAIRNMISQYLFGSGKSFRCLHLRDVVNEECRH